MPEPLRLSRRRSLSRRAIRYRRWRPGTCARRGSAPNPRFRALIAERDSQPIGYALFFSAYDTDHAERGLYLQDLYVAPEARRQGAARALMAAVARACEAEGGCYVFWNARPENCAGLAFYRAIGARQEPTVTLSLQPDALRRLAEETRPVPRCPA